MLIEIDRKRKTSLNRKKIVIWSGMIGNSLAVYMTARKIYRFHKLQSQLITKSLKSQTNPTN